MSGAAPAFTTAARTDVGRVRDANEDFVAEFEDPSGRRMLVVADGMGGHRGGATASRLCVETLGEVFHESIETPETLLRDALRAANERVHRTAHGDLELAGMGTTAVVLLLTPDDGAWVAHLGDSRAYLLRDGVLRPLTQDHTLVAAMVQRGLIEAEAAETHPRRHELVRCVGFHDEVEPEITRLEVLPGDRFLLCSDGLSGQVDEAEIAAILQRECPRGAVGALVEAANGAGGRDNVSVLVAAVPGGADTAVEPALPRLHAQTTAPLPLAPALAAARQAAERLAPEPGRARRVAAIIAVVAGVLTIAVLWLTLA